MKAVQLIFCLIVFFSSCNDAGKKQETRIVKNSDTINTQKKQVSKHEFGISPNPDKDSIWKKPVSYYISDPECSKIATAFYQGSFEPTQNEETRKLFDLTLTDNNKLRPFYRWCMDMIMQIGDTSQSAYIGQAAYKYAEKFPQEYFQYMDDDITTERYGMWTAAMKFGIRRSDQPIDRNRISTSIRSNCSGCDAKTKARIDKLVSDIMPAS